MNIEQVIEIGEDLVDFVKAVFPEDAEFESKYDSERCAFVCTVVWKLKNDESRPNKPSRIILIILSKELIVDSNYKNRKQRVKDKFKAVIESRYSGFDPNHNEPSEHSPPVVKWLIGNNDIN